MQTIPITLPGAVTPADAHSPRDLAQDNAAEGLIFGEELALMMMPNAALFPTLELPAPDAAAAAVTVAPDAPGLLLDSAQLVESLIAPATALPGSNVPVAAETLANAMMLPAAAAPSVPATGDAPVIPGAVPLQTAAPNAPRETPLVLAATPRPAQTYSARAADSRPAAARPRTSDDSPAPRNTIEAADPREPRAVPEAVVPREADTRGVHRASPSAAQAPAEPLLAAFVAERPALLEALPRGDTGSVGETLSPTALMSRWTPAAPAAEATPAPATARVDTPFGTDGWKDAFQQKIVWLVDRQQQSAELHLNPPNLGPVEVVLNMSDDAVSIAFVSPHLAVREAIETSLAELRATLQERGLAMGNALVSADQSGAREQFQQQAAEAARAARASGIELPGDLPGDTPRPRTTLLGLVDTFA
jgi:flagellar hook-length control protein FliK